MKLPKNARQWRREGKRVVDKTITLINKYETVDREEFKKIIDTVISEISKNRGIDTQVIGKKTQDVIAKMPAALEGVSAGERKWESIVTFLYFQYQIELDIVDLKTLNSIYAIQ